MAGAMLQMLAGAGGSVDTTPPTVTSSSSVSLAENTALSHSLTADEAVTWTKTGGADSSLFSLSGSTLSLTAKDYEAPADADANNTYIVQVTATDGSGNATNQTITVTVTDVVNASLDGTATNATLSNGNLTATHSNTSTGGARSTTLKSSGKYYFEITLTTVTGAASCVGLMTSAATYTNMALNNTNSVAVLKIDGTIWSNNAYSGRSLAALASGDVIGIAVDFTAQKAWLRKAPSGNWNGQVIGSQDPAGNVGGVSFSSFASLEPALAFAGSGTGATENFTANFGATSFSGSVPSGFTSGWPE